MQNLTAVAEAPRPAGGLHDLLRHVTPITPDLRIAEAAELMLLPQSAEMLCLPVVADDGSVVGVLTRHALNHVFLQRFGRELYGKQPVTELMHDSPTCVELELPLDQAAQEVTSKLGTPLTEDFVVTDGGRYVGMGIVLDLLGAMQVRLAAEAEALRSSRAALVQSEKMASLGQLVAGIAHEINTPLAYVRNNVEMVREMVEPAFAGAEGEAADDAEMLHGVFGDTLHGLDTIRELVLNLRNFSRQEAVGSVAVDLNQCVEQSLSIAASLLKNNRIQIIRQFGPLPRVRCAQSQITQVLLNLISNAAHALGEKGGRLWLHTAVEGPWARVTVQDDGCGIAPEHLRKIFDPFFTTKPVGEGTGLGLSICYQIIQSHGGRFEVASRPGVGTRFIVSLPLHAPGGA